ncbi:MAG: hypothetical protein JSV49_03670 [Thermoplasmata archaeon]|nr:MAG: hypothetical protein JSV49_03670 [Thermoplasmata archaeon]
MMRIKSRFTFILGTIALISIISLPITSAAAPGEAPTSRSEDVLGSADPLWWHTFGSGFSDEASSVLQTYDGGFVILGTTKFSGVGYTDIWLIKTNATGQQEWNRTYGGLNADVGYDMALTSDGGFIITGITRLEGNDDFDIYILKINSTGSEQWSRTFGGDEDDHGNSVKQTPEGDYIIGAQKGYLEEDFLVYTAWLIKLNSSGIEIWNKTYGENAHRIDEVIITSDGGYLIGGLYHKKDILIEFAWLMKTDSDGVEQWSSFFQMGYTNFITSVIQTSDGGYAFAGYTDLYKKYKNIWILKTDSKGEEQWNYTFGGNLHEFGEDIIEVSDGGFVICGNSGDYNAENFDVYLIRTDEEGKFLWFKTFGGKDYDFGYSLLEADNGNFVVAGTTMSFGTGASDIILMTFDPKTPEYVPNQPPICSISYPQFYDEISGGIQIQGTASDPDSYIFVIFIRIDDGSWFSVSESSNWVHFWNSTSVPNGEHTIHARAWDGVLYSENVSVNITVRNPEKIDDVGNGDKEEEDDDKGGWDEQYMILAIIIIILLIVIILISLSYRGKIKPPDTKNSKH